MVGGRILAFELRVLGSLADRRTVASDAALAAFERPRTDFTDPDD